MGKKSNDERKTNAERVVEAIVGEKKVEEESKKKGSWRDDCVLLVVLALVVFASGISIGGFVQRRYFGDVAVVDSSVEVVKLQKELEDLRATAVAERLRAVGELEGLRAEKMSLESEVEIRRVAYNELKVESAEIQKAETEKHVEKLAEARRDFEVQLSIREDEHKSEVVSFEEEISRLKTRINVLCEGVMTEREFRHVMLQEKDAENSARMKALNSEYEKVIRERDEALRRALRTESGTSIVSILSMSQYRFRLDEKLGVVDVAVRDLDCGECFVEVFTDKEVDGGRVSICCVVAGKEARKLKSTKNITMDDDVYLRGGIVTHCGARYVQFCCPGVKIL